MARWFASGLPCGMTNEDEQWLDERWDWLIDQFGESFPRKRPMILPTAEFFPHTDTTTREGVNTVFDQVCIHMDIRRSEVEFDFLELTEYELAKRTYDGYYDELGESSYRISIVNATLVDLQYFISTVAHELAHVHLLGKRRLTVDTPDHERVTDLLPIFFGMGIFSANTAIYESTWSEGMLHLSLSGKSGYLPMAMRSYALAKFACAHDERRAAWFKNLRPDVRMEVLEFVEVLRGETTISDDPIDPDAEAAPAADEDTTPDDQPVSAEELLSRYAAGERDFREVYFGNIELPGANLVGCDFTKADFGGALLNQADLSDCNCTEANFGHAVMMNCLMKNTILQGAHFNNAYLTESDLSGADLRDADFRSTSLYGANVTNTIRNITTDFRNTNRETIIADDTFADDFDRMQDHFAEKPRKSLFDPPFFETASLPAVAATLYFFIVSVAEFPIVFSYIGTPIVFTVIYILKRISLKNQTSKSIDH